MAADTAALAEPVGRFNHMLLIALGALAAGLTAAAVVQVLVGLRPLARLRAQLASQRAGGVTPIEGRFPSEIQPLVEDFNRVLAVNADMVQRARTQAGNLAHAVKTPLSILANAAAREDSPLAALVREQAALAQRQVDHHLARARAAAAAGAIEGRTPLRPPLEALLRVMRRRMRSAGWMSICRPFRRIWRFAVMSRTCRRWRAICWTMPANGRPGACASPPSVAATACC